MFYLIQELRYYVYIYITLNQRIYINFLTIILFINVSEQRENNYMEQ